MMTKNKECSLSRILRYAGNYKRLTILGCVLSAVSALLGLVPYVCVWLVARTLLLSWPRKSGAGAGGRYGSR